MAKIKSVLIWGGDDLLSAAIESLLIVRPDFQVTINPGHGGFAALNAALTTLKPNIVIVSRKELSDPKDLTRLLMQEYPSEKVIAIGYESTCLEIYSKHKVQLKDASDLIAVIEGPR